jgi:hypothetical protein
MGKTFMMKLFRAGLAFLLPVASLIAPAAASDNDQSVQSISGSSQRSISGSSQRSISGSSQRSISGSSQRSISGSSQRSISGSSQRSISGSSQRSISGSSQRSISGSSQRSLNDLVVYGPITSVGSGYISVLGRVFSWDSDLEVGADAIGQVAYVKGLENDGTLIASSVTLFDDLSVPGASIVMLAGRVESVDPGTGRVTVGGIEVDATSISLDVSIGDGVTVAGIQPVLGGVIIAQSISPLDDGALLRQVSDLTVSDLTVQE